MSQSVSDHLADEQPTGAEASPKRASRSTSALVLFIAITLAVFAGDQALKYFAFEHVAGRPIEVNPQQPGETFIPHHEMEVITGVLSLRLTANTGAVFGLGDGMQWLFIAVSILAGLVILRLFWVSPANAVLTHLALALILGGAMGNLYDRLMFNAVRDMIWLLPGTGLWPWIFNFADAALMVGVGLIVIVTWWNERPGQSAESARD